MEKKVEPSLIAFVESNYKALIEQYEQYNHEDHIAMSFQEVPFNDENLKGLVDVFNEYLINLSIIRTYEGSKLTMEELNHMEQLIKHGLIMVFQFANKDFLSGGVLSKMLILVYSLAKTNIPLDFLEIKANDEDLLYFELKDYN